MEWNNGISVSSYNGGHHQNICYGTFHDYLNSYSMNVTRNAQRCILQLTHALMQIVMQIGRFLLSPSALLQTHDVIRTLQGVNGHQW